jgi:hypothetical protein
VAKSNLNSLVLLAEGILPFSFIPAKGKNTCSFIPGKGKHRSSLTSPIMHATSFIIPVFSPSIVLAGSHIPAYIAASCHILSA